MKNETFNLGIQMLTLTPELAKKYNNDPYSSLKVPEANGVLVMKVLSKTPAALAGLRQGDVIVGVDGMPLTSVDQLQDMVEDSHFGSQQLLKLAIIRGDQNQQIQVKTA